ncbi:MAG: response regulator [Pseudomonadota bacterium]|nr:response regulator [Pseudomonadota bacterium]
MNPPSSSAAAERVLVLAPLGRDAALTCQLLGEAGLRGERCPGLDDLCRQMAAGAGAVLVAEEALAPARVQCLVRALDGQPPWSTLPLLVLTHGRNAAAREAEVLKALETRRGVTFLERPVRIMTLISTVQAALEARRRQYQIRDLLHQAEEGIRYRDEFLAMLGHELRNPLTPIRNVVNLLRLEDPPAAPTLHWGLDVIDRQTRQLAHLVDDLLDVARVTQGRIVLRPVAVALAEVMTAAAETARPLIEERRHALTLTLPPLPVLVRADPARLTQVLVNLLHNAAKYTEPGGRIWLSGSRQGGEAVVSVRDTGIGIPAGFLPQVFELFTQASHSLARSQGGLGLGLTLVRRLVQMHGGSVQAFSGGEGRGSEFVVRLPALEAADADAAPGVPAQGGGPASRRVLVVDDNPDVVRSLGALLGIMGHAVRLAGDGAAALEEARAFRPQVVLLDIGMPGMDGYAVARQLRREHGQTLQLIALTGYGQEQDLRRAREAGFDRHIVKPLEADQLRALLQAAGP